MRNGSGSCRENGVLGGKSGNKKVGGYCKSLGE